MQELNNKVPKSEHSLDKVYYYLNPSNPNEYKTITLLWNVYTKSHGKPLISNFVVGTPPPQMPPISKFHLSQLMRMTDQIPFWINEQVLLWPQNWDPISQIE